MKAIIQGVPLNFNGTKNKTCEENYFSHSILEYVYMQIGKTFAKRPYTLFVLFLLSV